MYLDNTILRNLQLEIKCIWTIQYWGISNSRLSVSGQYNIEESPTPDLSVSGQYNIEESPTPDLSVSGQFNIEELGVQDRVVYGKTDTRVYWRLYLDWYGFILYTKFYLHIDFRINLTQFLSIFRDRNIR